MIPISDSLAAAIVARIPHTASWVIEAGGSATELWKRYQAVNPKARYLVLGSDGPDDQDHIDGGPCGPEAQARLVDRLAGSKLDAVVCLDPETLAASVAALRPHLSDQAVVVAVFANAGSASYLGRVLRGGTADASARDHLSAVAAIRAADLFAISMEAAGAVGDQRALQAVEQAAVTLGVPVEIARERAGAEAWLVRGALSDPANRLTVVGLGLPKKAGVTDARVDYPLAGLASLPYVTASWGSGTVSFPRDARPGVFMLHRQFVHTPASIGMVQSMVDKGWIIVSEIDDDPHHWREYVDNDFRAFRGVHAVSVSTEPLARMIRQWTPEVGVFPNQVAALPETPPLTPKSSTGRMRLFFGALNRGPDWSSIMDQIVNVAVRHADRLELVVVHDQAFFDALPDGARKAFHPTLRHADYMTLMATCDLALLPLADTPFNRLKSDLKLIECAAAGVVPLCSPIVYADDPKNRAFARIVEDPADWGAALLDLLVSPAEVRRRRDLGLAYVKADRMHAHHIPAREAWFRDLIARRQSLEAARVARLGAVGLPVV